MTRLTPKLSSRRNSVRARPREWVGGRVVSPFYVMEPAPYRPQLTIWVEIPQGRIVFFDLADPSQKQKSFGALLATAMEAPMEGVPRKPAVVRVAESALADEIRGVLPEMPVVVAPTPEIDEVIESMAAMSASDPGAHETEGRGHKSPSYFEGGRVGKKALGHLFRAAMTLYRIAPWKVADDTQVIRVDIPDLEVHAGALSIIGKLGQNRGVILFPSIDGFERFLDAADVIHKRGRKVDFGTTALSLNFEAKSQVTPEMVQEVKDNKWPVAGPKAYPVIMHMERDGVLRPITEKDIRIMSACAASLSAFFVKHSRLFERNGLHEPVCESYFDDDDLEVRFTIPHEAGELFAINERPASGRSAARPVTGKARKPEIVGRNRPCPCGSGKKYKLCCLDREQSAGPESSGVMSGKEPETAPAAFHDLDRAMVDKLDRFARARLGPDWIRPAAASYPQGEDSAMLFGPWSLYQFRFDGKPVIQWYFEERGRRFSREEFAWIEAQRDAWLSVWEIMDTDAGKTLTLKDLLSGESRIVHETTASRSLAKRDAILARVVDYAGTFVLCGMYPRALRPADADAVVRRTRTWLRKRSDIAVQRLRDPEVGHFLIALWEETMTGVITRASRLPALRNTDGHAILLTVDHFACDPIDLAEIRSRLASAHEVEDAPQAADPDQVFAFVRPGNAVNRGMESTVIAMVRFSGEKLLVETNSLERADSMRKRIEALLGNLVRHQGRTHSDPVASIRKPGVDRPDEPSRPAPSDEINRRILEMKTGHYADWADQPLPALGGKTPKAAVRTPAGRRKVDLLLKELENLESRLPEEQRFDVGLLRRELELQE